LALVRYFVARFASNAILVVVAETGLCLAEMINADLPFTAIVV